MSGSDLLATSRVTPASGDAARWVVFLHGILGSGANFRSFARRVVEGLPGWGALLVDLRMHGASQGLAPPHTVRRAAEDVARAVAALDAPVEAVVGHSFGGKVTLSLVELLEGRMSRAVIVDAMPGPRPTARGSETTVAVVEMLSSFPAEFRTREAFVARAVEQGTERPIAEWLAMNLVRRGDAFAFKLDLAAIRELLADYFAIDLWHVLERPPGRVELEVVVGGKSRVFDDEARARLERAASYGRTRAHLLPEAGHWVHVDDPDGLFRIVKDALRSVP